MSKWVEWGKRLLKKKRGDKEHEYYKCVSKSVGARTTRVVRDGRGTGPKAKSILLG